MSRPTIDGLAAGQSRDAAALVEAISLLGRLHRPKDKLYGDAWRRRGEVLGIFANIARKADRLSGAIATEQLTPVERLGDTAADLAVYAGKYLSWLAETQPRSFESVRSSLSAAECEARRGPEALERILAELPIIEDHGDAKAPPDLATALEQTIGAFSELEAVLMGQAEGRAAMATNWSLKVTIAWRLTWASTWFLVRLGQAYPQELAAIRRDVESMQATP
jgi:hypothetical protein